MRFDIEIPCGVSVLGVALTGESLTVFNQVGFLIRFIINDIIPRIY